MKVVYCVSNDAKIYLRKKIYIGIRRALSVLLYLPTQN